VLNKITSKLCKKSSYPNNPRRKKNSYNNSLTYLTKCLKRGKIRIMHLLEVLQQTAVLQKLAAEEAEVPVQQEPSLVSRVGRGILHTGLVLGGATLGRMAAHYVEPFSPIVPTPGAGTFGTLAGVVAGYRFGDNPLLATILGALGGGAAALGVQFAKGRVTKGRGIVAAMLGGGIGAAAGYLGSKIRRESEEGRMPTMLEYGIPFLVGMAGAKWGPKPNWLKLMSMTKLKS
jgi:hypothetical protein